MASMRSPSNDDTLDLHELPHPSEGLSANTHYLVDLLPTDPCLSVDLWVHQFDDNISSGDPDQIAIGNGEPDSMSQLSPSECEGYIFSDILSPSPSNMDSSFDKENEYLRCELSPLPMNGPWTEMVGLTYFPLAFMNIHSSPKSELKCPAPHENPIDLDDDLDVLFDDSGLCTFDDADRDDVMMLAFE